MKSPGLLVNDKNVDAVDGEDGVAGDVLPQAATRNAIATTADAT
jgi:hypothetical protein